MSDNNEFESLEKPAEKRKKVPKMPSKKETKLLKESLIQQLEVRGANVKLYQELISSAVWFWQQERYMQSDIAINGFSYEAVSAAGKIYDKENPSVKNALLYNNRYCAILAALGLSTDGFKTGKKEEDNPDGL